MVKTRNLLTAVLLGATLLTFPTFTLSSCSGKNDQSQENVAPRTDLDKVIEKYWTTLQDDGSLPENEIQGASEATLDYLKRLNAKMSEITEIDDMDQAYPKAVELLQSDLTRKSGALYQYLISQYLQNGDTAFVNPMTVAHQNIIELASDIQRRVHSQYAETLADAIDDFNNE